MFDRRASQGSTIRTTAPRRSSISALVLWRLGDNEVAERFGRRAAARVRSGRQVRNANHLLGEIWSAPAGSVDADDLQTSWPPF